MDTEELTSHENKRLCAEPAGQEESQPEPSQEGLEFSSLENATSGETPQVVRVLPISTRLGFWVQQLQA